MAPTFGLVLRMTFDKKLNALVTQDEGSAG